MSKVKFCEFCGKLLKDDGTCDCPEAVKNAGKGNRKGNLHVLPRKGILAAVAVLVVAVIAGILLSSGMEKVDLAQYLDADPALKGLNGQGSIYVYKLFDRSALESDLMDSMPEIKDSDDLELIFIQGAESLQECEQAVEDIVVTVWKNGVEVQELTGLSNGDEIEIEAKSLNSTNKYLKKKFQTGTVKFTVNGLPDGKAVDIFKDAGLEVSFSGINGSGRVSLNYNADAIPEINVSFAVEGGTGYRSNGDEVKVVVNYNEQEWESKGYYLLETYRTYTVEGLSKYLAAVDEISAEQLDQMNAGVETSLKNEAETLWIRNISIEKTTFLGNYLLNKRSDSTSALGAPNILYFVYKVDVFENFAPDGGDDNHFSYYYCSGYEGVIVDPEGNIDLDAAYQTTPRDSFEREIKVSSDLLFGTSYVYYGGFETLEELFKDCVNDYSDQYSYVSTVKEAE